MTTINIAMMRRLKTFCHFIDEEVKKGDEEGRLYLASCVTLRRYFSEADRYSDEELVADCYRNLRDLIEVDSEYKQRIEKGII